MYDNLDTDMKLSINKIGSPVDTNPVTYWNYSSGTVTFDAWSFSGGDATCKFICSDILGAVE